MRVVGPAATTRDARRLVAEQKPKLALVDVNLKKELATGLIEELHGQGVLVIVVSGYAVPPMPAGMVAAFVQKPFSEADLITALRVVQDVVPGLSVNDLAALSRVALLDSREATWAPA
jgi:two-component system, response regulator PdtaR